MNLVDAIVAIQQKTETLASADQVRTAKQAEFDAASAAKAGADKNDADAVVEWKAALDDLIKAASDAKDARK